MSMLRTVGRALAALAMAVPVMVWEAGKWVLRCMPGYHPPASTDVFEQYAEAADEAPVLPPVDQRLENIRSIAHALVSRQPIPDALFDGVGQPVVQWLGAMNMEMLLSVSNAAPAALRRHMRGETPIRGLLACDAESIAEYQAAVARESEPEIERIRRRLPQEPLLPAFGPMC